jgi:hypothetical protein
MEREVNDHKRSPLSQPKCGKLDVPQLRETGCPLTIERGTRVRAPCTRGRVGPKIGFAGRGWRWEQPVKAPAKPEEGHHARYDPGGG